MSCNFVGKSHYSLKEQSDPLIKISHKGRVKEGKNLQERMKVCVGENQRKDCENEVGDFNIPTWPLASH